MGFVLRTSTIVLKKKKKKKKKKKIIIMPKIICYSSSPIFFFEDASCLSVSFTCKVNSVDQFTCTRLHVIITSMDSRLD